MRSWCSCMMHGACCRHRKRGKVLSSQSSSSMMAVLRSHTPMITKAAISTRAFRFLTSHQHVNRPLAYLTIYLLPLANIQNWELQTVLHTALLVGTAKILCTRHQPEAGLAPGKQRSAPKTNPFSQGKSHVSTRLAHTASHTHHLLSIQDVRPGLMD